MSAEKATNKTPIYKKWWFWVIIVIVVIAIGGAVAKNDDGKVGTIDGGSSDSASDSTDYKVGDIIKVDGQEVAVTSVVYPYISNSDLASPKDGKEYVKVNLQITNASDSTISYNALYWRVEDGNGDITNYLDAAFAQDDDFLSSGDLAKGGKKTGSIVFEVPKNSTGLKVHFQPSVMSNKNIVINLQ